MTGDVCATPSCLREPEYEAKYCDICRYERDELLRELEADMRHAAYEDDFDSIVAAGKGDES